MLRPFYQKIANRQFYITALFILIIVVVTAQCFLLGTRLFDPHAVHYEHYKNYLIFKQSFYHLVQHNNLYLLYPDLHLDYFKYSPTFALLMAPFAALPDFAGLLLWNLLNGLVLFYAIYRLPLIRNKQRIFIIAFILIELITALQNSQSNALIAGLIILAFVMLEKKNMAMATLCIVLTVFIKLFGGMAFALFLFYPNKKKAVMYTTLWMVILLLIPLLVNSPEQLYTQYRNWANLLHNDYSASLGLSAEGLLHNWFGMNAKNAVIAVGMVLFCLPLFRFRLYNDLYYKMNMLVSVLIWIVIFNHKAESPTFIIAVSGVAIWFTLQEKRKENIVLLVTVFILTILSPTDLFPAVLRNNYVIPYDLKVLPCILVWVKLVWDMMVYEPVREMHISENQILLRD